MKSFKKIIIVAVAFVLSLLSLCACNVEKKNVFISSISVGDDFKTDFVLGEELNLDGIKLNLLYEDGSIGFVYLDKKMITGFNTLTEGSKTMAITYEGITLDIKYSVVDPAVYNSLIYTVNDNCVTITGLNNFYTSQTLTIPNTIQGFPVTEIGDGAFKNKYLYSVTLPDSVTRIGNSAFMNCSVLISVNTPASLVSIGEQAFYNCVKLSAFDFGDSVKNIGAYAFQYGALTQLTLPSDTTVGEGAFSNCNKLTYLEADFTNSQTPANIFKNSMKLTAINTLVINGKIDSINQDIFYYGENNQYKLGQNVRAVTLPETVTQIDQYTFEGFSNLRSFTVPDSVAIIGDGAFKDCISLTSFDVGNATDIGDKILYNCVSLKNISLYLNNTVTFENYFGDSASDLFSINLNVNTDLNYISPLFFSYTDTDNNNVKFTSVKSITFSESVNSIENETFKDFTLVDSINLSDIEIIGDYAFQNCINLKHLTGSENNNSLDKLSCLGEGAFWGAVSITEIFLPETLVNVKQNVFKNCTGIKNLALSFKVVNDAGSSPAQSSAVALLNHQISYDANLSETGLYYFFGDTVPSLLSLTVYNLQVLEKSSLSVGKENNYIKINTISEIILPSSLTEIKEGTFENLPISQINIPSQITILEKNLFSNCSLLETVNLNNIVTIKDGVFSNCVSLSNIVFGNQLSSIGNEAFMNCSSLESISVPSSVSTIGSAAFKNCATLVEVDLLYDIYSNNNLNEISESLFEGCEKLKRVYDGQGIVPVSDSYVILPYTVTKIGKNAFKGCVSINNVNLSKSSAVGVTQIGESAFENCIGLRNLNVDNVQNFGSSSFLNCNLLGSVQFKASNVIINESAFQNCYSLSGLEIGANINSVKSKAFYNCYSLSRIEIKSSSVLFGNSVFACESRDASVTELILPLNIRKYSESSGTFAKSYSDINLSYYFGTTLLPLLFYLEVLSGLTTVTYSETSNADYTFKGATNVETLILPDTITTIYNKALSKLTTINSLTIPFVVKDESQNSAASFKGLTHLFGTTDFSNITDLTILDNGLTSSGVTISENAFQNCTGLQEVDLSYVTSIGNSAFKGCVNLHHIGGLAAVTSIGNNAFENCPLSDNIVFSSNITDIGDNAFKGCLGLTSVAFASNTDFSALTVGASPFNGCFNITAFKAPFAFGTGNNMPTLLSWFGEFGVSELNLTSLEIYSADTIASNFLNDENGEKYTSLNTLYIDAVNINENAFSGCNAITTLAFGERLTAIGNQAFKNCTRITTLVLPSSLQILGTSVFQGCSSVTTLSAPLNLREAGNDTKISRRLNYYFGGINSVSLTSFTLVNNGTESQKISLSENAFSSFVNLTTIALEGFVSEIGENAFSDCSKLTSITGLENVISIGDQAFSNTAVETLVFSELLSVAGNRIFYNCDDLISLTIPFEIKSEASADSILRDIYYFFGENSDTNQINLQFLSIISENGLILENDVFCGLDSLTGIELGDKVEFSSGVDYQTLINLKNLKINSIITLPEEVMDFPTGLIPQNIEKIEFIDNATASLYLQNDNWKVFSEKFIYPEISEN